MGKFDRMFRESRFHHSNRRSLKESRNPKMEEVQVILFSKTGDDYSAVVYDDIYSDPEKKAIKYLVDEEDMTDEQLNELLEERFTILNDGTEVSIINAMHVVG